MEATSTNIMDPIDCLTGLRRRYAGPMVSYQCPPNVRKIVKIAKQDCRASRAFGGLLGSDVAEQ